MNPMMEFCPVLATTARILYTQAEVQKSWMTIALWHWLQYAITLPHAQQAITRMGLPAPSAPRENTTPPPRCQGLQPAEIARRDDLVVMSLLLIHSARVSANLGTTARQDRRAQGKLSARLVAMEPPPASRHLAALVSV